MNDVNDGIRDRRAETRAFLDEVADRLPLVEVLRQRGVRLTRTGRTFRGPCPIHRGGNPNFVVLAGGRRYYCHKCGASGDVIDYLQQRADDAIPSFRDALAWLSDTAGVALPGKAGDLMVPREIQLDGERHPLALEFALRLFHAMRNAFPDVFERSCETLGVPVSLATRCGAGLVPDGNRLANNVMRYCAPEAWPAFHHLGLVDHQFGSGAPAGMLVDRVPTETVIWPVIDRGRLAGLVILDAQGERIYSTEPGRTVDPRFATLATPDGDYPWSVTDADPSATTEEDTAAATVWRTARAFWGHADEVPGPHLVPAWCWGSAQDAPRVRTQLRGRSAIGVIVTDDDLLWWLREPLLDWVDGVYDGRPNTRATDGVLHPIEAVMRWHPDFDASPALASVTSPLRRLVMTGWLTQTTRKAASVREPDSRETKADFQVPLDQGRRGRVLT